MNIEWNLLATSVEQLNEIVRIVATGPPEYSGQRYIRRAHVEFASTTGIR
jgi:hypothetical protein